MSEILEDIFLLWTVCGGLINSTAILIAVFFMCGTRTWIDWYHELTAPGRYLIVEMTAIATSKLSTRYHVSTEGSSSSPQDWKESLAFCRVEKLVRNGNRWRNLSGVHDLMDSPVASICVGVCLNTIKCLLIVLANDWATYVVNDSLVIIITKTS